MLQEGTSQPQFVVDESPAGDATKAYFSCLMENYKNTCVDVSGSYLRKETGPSSEVAVDHTVCKIPQGSEKIEASNPPH